MLFLRLWRNIGIVYRSVLILIIDPESLRNVISVEFFTSDTMPIVCSVCGMQKKGYNSLNAEFLNWNYYDQMMILDINKYLFEEMKQIVTDQPAPSVQLYSEEKV